MKGTLFKIIIYDKDSGYKYKTYNTLGNARNYLKNTYNNKIYTNDRLRVETLRYKLIEQCDESAKEFLDDTNN